MNMNIIIRGLPQEFCTSAKWKLKKVFTQYDKTLQWNQGVLLALLLLLVLLHLHS